MVWSKLSNWPQAERANQLVKLYYHFHVCTTEVMEAALCHVSVIYGISLFSLWTCPFTFHGRHVFIFACLGIFFIILCMDIGYFWMWKGKLQLHWYLIQKENG